MTKQAPVLLGEFMPNGLFSADIAAVVRIDLFHIERGVGMLLIFYSTFISNSFQG